MKSPLRIAFAFAAAAVVPQALAQVTFYEGEGFGGRSFTAARPVDNLPRAGFHDRASSAVVVGDRWEVCERPGYGGRCVVLRPGRYPSLAAIGLSDRVASVRDIAREARIEDYRYAPMAAPSQVTFFEDEGFRGRTFSTESQVRNLRRFGFNDSASSVIVSGDNWEVCQDPRFAGRCVILRPGRYPSLASMGLSDRISSVREVAPSARVDERRYAPAPVVAPDYSRRGGEPVFEANVTSVRAVVAASGQRCWMEPAQVPAERRANVPGAIAGAIIGGIIGHQVGSGSGRDIATAGGAIGGAALGSTVGRNGTATAGEVQRCENVSSDARPDYWDVTYTFRGIEHRVQMQNPPGSTIYVNGRGEPRV